MTFPPNTIECVNCHEPVDVVAAYIRWEYPFEARCPRCRYVYSVEPDPNNDMPYIVKLQDQG